MTLTIGRLTLRHNALQSPMCGCTDLPFRRIARRFGCDLAFAEMVKDRPVLEGNRRTMEMIATADWDRPLGIQLAGRDPRLMAEAARRLEQHGADLVDVNLGCPVRKIVRDGCGAALLREPAQVGRIVERMTAAVEIPVTVKMRTGFDDEPDGAFLEVARTAAASGAAAITVHGRTRLQKFRGITNQDAIRAVKEAVSIPVIGNGNIHAGPDAARMLRETGCDGVMVARGALGNPWIYREIASYLETGEAPPRPSAGERVSVLREHFRHQREFYGDRKAFRLIRRVIHWFVKGMRGAPVLRRRGNRIESEEEFEDLMRAFEDRLAAETARA